MNNPGTPQLDPQLDESIRISHLEPKRGDEKKLGFLSFGHWAEVPGSRVPSAAESLHQAIDLAVGGEDIGLDGAFFRVHHFDQQQATPYPLLSAIAAKTERIELGTGVIDMRYENPLYMAELAATADLIAAGRLQLGVSRGSPESVIRGFESFGYYPVEGENESDMARRHLDIFLNQQQAQQIRLFRSEWVKAGNSGVPRVSVSRSVLPIIDEISARYFGRRAAEDSQDYTGIIDNSFSRFGRSYIGDPADIAEELARDEAVQMADTVLLTIPNQLGVDFNLKMLEAIVKEIKPALTTK